MMIIEYDGITMQTTQKQEWEQPQLIELDVNKTESGLEIGIEVDIIAPLLGKIS